MFPPTPTGLPPGVAPVFIGDDYSLWAAAPYAIQLWNLGGAAREIFQAIILIAILIAVGYTAVKARNSIDARRQAPDGSDD